LSELDEVQRYFSQKLTGSFPDFGYGNASQPSHGEPESDRRGLMSREADPSRCHLLEKSRQLVSRVSSLINGELSLGLGFLVRSCLKVSSNCLGNRDPFLVLVVSTCWSFGTLKLPPLAAALNLKVQKAAQVGVKALPRYSKFYLTGSVCSAEKGRSCRKAA